MLSQYKSRQLYLAILITILSCIFAGLSFLLPVVSSVENTFAAHSRTAFAMALGVLYTGSAIWFLGGLANFKTRLRISYILLCVGLIIFSIAMIQLPIIGLLDQWDSAWATGGGVILIFMLASVFLYLAMRQLSRLIGLRTRLNSLLAVSGATILITILFGIAGSLLVQYELEGVELYIAAVGWTVGFNLQAGLLALRIRKVIGESYKRALYWQAVALISMAIAAVHEAIGTALMNNEHWFQNYGVYLWPFIVAGFLFLRACYEFRSLTATATTADSEESIAQVQDSDYIQSIMSVAALASRPEEIDVTLDDVRAITATMDGVSKLTEEQKHKLILVYRKLEEYLTAKDPLRTFKHEEVREYITPGFAAVLNRRATPAKNQPATPSQQTIA